MLHLVAGVLFFLLSPGVLLTIPAGSKGLFASGQTSVLAAAVHAAVFVAAIYLLTGVVTEGFAACSPNETCERSKKNSRCNRWGETQGNWIFTTLRCGYCSYYGANQGCYTDAGGNGEKLSNVVG